MKVKVKGLVFMGFAAAIFAANAMAVDNTVTSKEYVDTKFQTKANLATQGDASGNTLNTSSDTTYPSEKKVAAALEAVGGTVGTGTLTVNQNSVSAGTFNANATDSATISILAPDWDSSTGQQAILNKPTITNISGDIDSAVSTDTKELPTTYAVKQYVEGAITDLHLEDTYQNLDDGLKYVVSKEGVWEDVANAVTGDTNTIAVTADTSTGALTVRAVTSAVVESGTALTTGGQVHDYVQGAIADLDLDSTYQDLDSGTKYMVSKEGVWEDVADAVAGDTNTIAVTADTSTGALTVSAVTSAVVESGTALTTGGQVYDAIQSATGGNVIPSMPSTCDSDTPCALVTNSSGQPVWEPIAQATDSVGA